MARNRDTSNDLDEHLPALVAEQVPCVDPPLVVGVDEAIAKWGTTCGPVAIAGVLGQPLERVREAVSVGGRFKGYMGIRDVRAALARLGAKTLRSWSKPLEPVDVWDIGDELGRFALKVASTRPLLVMLRWCGPWDRVPRAAATYRHLIGYRRAWLLDPDYWAQGGRGPGIVCDINTPCQIDAVPWVPAYTWRNTTAIHLPPPRGDGRVAADWIAELGE